MVNSLLSTLLVATQVLSWNAAPMYLCLEPDGEVCIDFGPATCGCCHATAGTAESYSHQACEDDGCSHDEQASKSHSNTDAQAAAPPCECTHVQISQSQTATVLRVSAAIERSHALLPAMIDPIALINPIAPTRVAWVGAATLPSPALALRAGIVLRC